MMLYEGRSLNGNLVRHVFSRGASGPFGADFASICRRLKRGYERIFRMHRLFGDDIGRQLYSVSWRLQKRFSVAIPGWYDTHATLVRKLHAVNSSSPPPHSAAGALDRSVSTSLGSAS